MKFGDPTKGHDPLFEKHCLTTYIVTIVNVGGLAKFFIPQFDTEFLIGLANFFGSKQKLKNLKI